MANPQMTWRTLTIDQNGELSATPSKMSAHTDDGIAWFVVNDSPVQVKVKIKDFKKKSSGTGVTAVDFYHVRATVESGERGMVVGRVVFEPSGASGTTVLTKYTIELRSDLFDFDYDPDLEIEKP
jgi:hypothetical protein